MQLPVMRLNLKFCLLFRTVDLEELNSQDYDYSDSDTDEAVVCKQHNNPTSHNIYEIFRFVIGYLLPFIVISKLLSIQGTGAQEGKGVVFTTNLIAWSGFNPHPGYVVAFLG